MSRFRPQRRVQIALIVIKHSQGKRRIWRKLHLAVDTKKHEVIYANLSLSNVTNREAFPGLICQKYRKIKVALADRAYDKRVSDTRVCHDKLRRKKIRSLIPPRSGVSYWSADLCRMKLSVGEPAI
ncbi:MAG: transposase [Serratia symbiotica]|nr:transposase [Serratia symbiotica]